MPIRAHERAAAALLAACAAAGTASAQPDAAWPVIGRQGLVAIVIVPAAQAADEPAYRRQLAALCDPERTCFLNFYTNTTGAPQSLPLPAAVADEATATYRRSMKNGVEVFRWSCRLKIAGAGECF